MSHRDERYFTPNGVSTHVVRCLQTFNHYVVDDKLQLVETYIHNF